MGNTIRVTDVRIPSASKVFVNQVLSTGLLSHGTFVSSVETMVAAFSGATYGLCVNSGTSALQLALEYVLEPGQPVAIPAFTFAGTANAVVAAGGEPVVVDVGEDRLLNSEAVPANCEVVVPVHLFGAYSPPVADRVNVEDGAQAIGHPIGYGAISLYGSKTVGCGEGGVFVTSDPEALQYAARVADQGQASKYEHVMSGFNYRLTDLQAAVALGQLVELPVKLAQRRANGEYLWQALHDLPVGLPNPFAHLWHQFVVEVPERDAIADWMAGQGVETAVHYPYSLSQVEWLESEPMPVAERLARECLSLPVHEHLSKGELDRVVSVFRSAVDLFVSA